MKRVFDPGRDYRELAVCLTAGAFDAASGPDTSRTSERAFRDDVVHAMLAAGMSLVLAVRDDLDVVIASDGRVLSENYCVMSEDSLKTLALNASLCLGLAGPTNTMRQVLTALGIKCRGSHPIDLLSACQNVACPVDVDYRDARNEVTSVLRWMERSLRPRQHSRRVPSVILAGKSDDQPALCGWAYPARAMEAAGAAGYSEEVVGSVPGQSTLEWAEFRQVLRGEGSTRRAEERLTRAVHLCARYFGAEGPINETVFLRRMSRGFELDRVESAPAATRGR